MPDAEAASFFFHDQAANNEAQHAQIDMQHVLSQQDVPDLPPDCFKAILVGQQAVTKGRRGSDALNKVHIILCCIRLPQHGSDLLLTLNSPIFISEKSAAAEHAGACSVCPSQPNLFASYGCCSESYARLLPAMRPAWISHSNRALYLGSGSESWLVSGGVHGLPPCTLLQVLVSRAPT